MVIALSGGNWIQSNPFAETHRAEAGNGRSANQQREHVSPKQSWQSVFHDRHKNLIRPTLDFAGETAGRGV